MSGLWFHHRQAWFIIRQYVALLAGLSLAWEILQTPLYTLWTEERPAFVAFAIFHCTGGDVLIGSASLLLALILGREQAPAQWHWRRIAIVLIIVGPAYTIFSEWLNTSLFRWTYSDLMPTLQVGGIVIGLSPLLQWLIVPPLALYLSAGRPTGPLGGS